MHGFFIAPVCTTKGDQLSGDLLGALRSLYDGLLTAGALSLSTCVLSKRFHGGTFKHPVVHRLNK